MRNRQRPVQEIHESGFKKAVHHGATAFLDRPGEGHVKAEFLEDIRIAPAQQMLALGRRQLLRLAPADVAFAQGCAERLEAGDDHGREILQRRMRPNRNQREEGPKLAENKPGDFETRIAGGETLGLCNQ